MLLHWICPLIRSKIFFVACWRRLSHGIIRPLVHFYLSKKKSVGGDISTSGMCLLQTFSVLPTWARYKNGLFYVILFPNTLWRYWYLWWSILSGMTSIHTLRLHSLRSGRFVMNRRSSTSLRHTRRIFRTRISLWFQRTLSIHGPQIGRPPRRTKKTYFQKKDYNGSGTHKL